MANIGRHTNVPKTASYQEATSGLQDVLHFLETKGNMKTVIKLAKVIADVQSGLSKGEASRTSHTSFLNRLNFVIIVKVL